MLMATYSFALEIDGVTVAYFREASGLSTEVEVIEHQVVNETGRQVTQKIAGHATTGEVTLKRSMDGTTYLSDWFKEVEDGKFDAYRRNGSIVMFDPQGAELVRWTFFKGWPRSWTASDLGTDAGNGAIEEVVITHEGLFRA